MSRYLSMKRGLVGLGAAALAAALYACGGAGGTVNTRTTAGTTAGAGGSSAGTTTGGAGGTTTSGGNGSGTTSGNSTSGNTTSGNTSGGGTSGDGGFQSCAANSTKAQSLPLDMYIMLDQSGSMADSNKWTSVTNALNSFVGQPNLAGISVGLQYFALPASGSSCPSSCNTQADSDACTNGGGFCVSGQCYGCGGGGDSCNAADYATPEVEIAPLPGVASAISSSISQHSPSTSTPTSAALQGAINHAKAWGQAHPNHVVIDVLATDGDPTECDTTMSDIDQIAANGLTGTPKVLTFVIGVGSSLSNLNGIAAAGGTTQAYLVDTSSNAQQQFLDALNNIRGSALGCQYNIPQPDGGSSVDYQQVNVQYTPGSGGPAEQIPAVTSASACPASGDAWYYDNPASPSVINLCPSTCQKVSADSTGEVDILTGCSTVFK